MKWCDLELPLFIEFIMKTQSEVLVNDYNFHHMLSAFEAKTVLYTLTKGCHSPKFPCALPSLNSQMARNHKLINRNCNLRARKGVILGLYA